MSSYLAYSYSSLLTKEEELRIDKKTAKARKEFCNGFVKGCTFSLIAYSVYSIAKSVPAYADDSKILKPPIDTAPVQPAPTPQNKPGFKPLSEKSKGMYVGGVGSVCAAAAQSGDFLLGLSCAFLIIIAGIISNRPK